MGDLIHVNFKTKRRIDPSWLQEQEDQFSRMMKEPEPTPDEYYGNTPSDSE